jgi:hypothetical protein
MSTDHLHAPKTKATIRKVGDVMAHQIAPLFTKGALVTIIVRFPDNDEADFFMADRSETLPELRRFLQRCEGRDQLEHDTEGEKR